MKRLMVGITVFLFIVGSVFAQPNPFREIKIVALSVPPDADGNYLLLREIKEGSKTFRLAIGYVPSSRGVGVAISDGEKTIITLYRENNNTYEQAIAIGPSVIESKIISEEEAWAVARKVLPYFKKGEIPC